MSLSGLADLPLHSGRVPRWLFERMVKLSGLVVQLLVDRHGVRGTVRLFSNPIFFQSFNNIIGMDWDSSGSTTVTTAALKEALAKVDVGIRVVGGKGVSALETPREIEELGRLWDIDVEGLKVASRLVAKVDNVALQDGYRLYHHAMLVGEDGSWAVIQQGLNDRLRMARRYHWWMETSFVNDPHEGIVGVRGGRALNLVSRLSEGARKAIIDVVRQGPQKVERDLAVLRALASGNRLITDFVDAPYYRPYAAPPLKARLREVDRAVLERAREASSFRELLLVRGLGPSTMLALALIAELVYREPVDWNDPANVDPRRFTFALGGKDGSPYPIDRRVYDAVIELLGSLVDRLRRDGSLAGYLKRLYEWARRLELPVDDVRPTPG